MFRGYFVSIGAVFGVICHLKKKLAVRIARGATLALRQGGRQFKPVSSFYLFELRASFLNSY